VTELNLRKIGSELLTDSPPSGEPYPGWNLENILCQQMSDPKRKDLHLFLKPAVGEETREVLILGWLEKRDPFTQSDLLDREEEQLQDLIFRIRTSLCISYRESLANRLVTLINDAKEEEEFAGVGIAVDSLRNFYNFFQSNTDLKLPAISLTPDCNIYASWRSEKGQLFSVLFLPGGDTRFVIFKPNDLHPERQVRISGAATTDILMETVAPHGVWNWISG
jgi:hypothetical protein